MIRGIPPGRVIMEDGIRILQGIITGRTVITIHSCIITAGAGITIPSPMPSDRSHGRMKYCKGGVAVAPEWGFRPFPRNPGWQKKAVRDPDPVPIRLGGQDAAVKAAGVAAAAAAAGAAAEGDRYNPVPNHPAAEGGPHRPRLAEPADPK